MTKEPMQAEDVLTLVSVGGSQRVGHLKFIQFLQHQVPTTVL